MSNCTRYLGLDVHAETITAAGISGPWYSRHRIIGSAPFRVPIANSVHDLSFLHQVVPAHHRVGPRPDRRQDAIFGSPDKSRPARGHHTSMMPMLR